MTDKLAVRDLVSRQQAVRLFSTEPDDTVQKAAATIKEHGISAIAVVEEQKDGPHLVGILSEKDISHLVAEGEDPATTPVQAIMTTDLITVDIDSPLWKIATHMLDKKVRHVPVLEEGKLITTISIRDVLGLLVEKLSSENRLLRGVCPRTVVIVKHDCCMVLRI